ncbi:MAG: hypothetical protein WDM81_12360 [Rhizomicrobium sp.]
MMKAKHTTTAGELVRQFSHYSDLALSEPVIVTKNGLRAKRADFGR